MKKQFLHIAKFIFFNILIISLAFFIAYKVRKYSLKNKSKKNQTFMQWFNQGKITPKGLFVSLLFGIVFGLIWTILDYFSGHLKKKTTYHNPLSI